MLQWHRHFNYHANNDKTRTKTLLEMVVEISTTRHKIIVYHNRHCRTYQVNANTIRKNMKAELQALIGAERKHQRELKELRDLRSRTMQTKAPDQKLIAMIDNEISLYVGQK